MTNIVERLYQLMLRPGWQSKDDQATLHEARAEIERLRGLYDSATDQAVRYADEIERLTAVLEMISGKHQCIDNLMSDKDIARRALEPKP